MTKFETDLCSPCPSRGLCLGPVAIEAADVRYTVDNGVNIEGVSITATDNDGVVSVISKHVPETFTGKRGRVGQTKDVGIDANTSDVIFEAMKENPDVMLSAISRRAAECKGPAIAEARGWSVISQTNKCPATALRVLTTLAQKS